MFLNKEEQIFLRHIEDLRKSSVKKQIEIFSDFLSVREISILKNSLSSFLNIKWFFFGGIKDAERQMICFFPPFLKEEEIYFPIRAIKVSIQGSKFQKKLPKHGDYLGAIMGLGIDRRLVGDIYVDDEQSSSFLFCADKISSFIIENLESVGNAKVNTELIELSQVKIIKKIEEKVGIVSSLRLDIIVGEAFHISRTRVKDLFQSESVIVNGSLANSLHKEVREGDIISVRGYGKFVFYKVEGSTRKDKFKILYGLYS